MVVSDGYPVEIGIAYVFLVGYLLRTLFVTFHLPASVGVILSGFVFSFFFQAGLLVARDLLQQLSFFLVLLTAGLEITLKDLRPHIFVMAIGPAVAEIASIGVYARLVMEWSWIEGLVLGTVLVAIGDGLVIPKMKEFGCLFPAHPLPKLVFTWAPLEASFVLTLFGILTGLSEPVGQGSVNIPVLVGANLFRIVATLFAATLLGSVSGWLIPKREQLKAAGQQIFTGSASEAFLMVLAVSLVAFGLGSGEDDNVLIPMGFAPGSVFQPELMVIITGTIFGAVAESRVLYEVEYVLGGVWVFGQIMLFSMLGSRTTLGILSQLYEVLPIILIGLLFRLMGIFVGMHFTIASRHCPCTVCTKHRRDMIVKESLFCFLCTIPRATIQGALGAVPVNHKFFQHSRRRHQVDDFIFIAARLYIVCMSVFGMILLNTFGPRLLKASRPRDFCERRFADANKVATITAEAQAASNVRRAAAVQLVAERYMLDPDELTEALQAASRRAESAFGKGGGAIKRSNSEPSIRPEPHATFNRSLSAPDAFSFEVLDVKAPTPWEGNTYLSTTSINQFDVRGDIFTNKAGRRGGLEKVSFEDERRSGSPRGNLSSDGIGYSSDEGDSPRSDARQKSMMRKPLFFVAKVMSKASGLRTRSRSLTRSFSEEERSMLHSDNGT